MPGTRRRQILAGETFERHRPCCGGLYLTERKELGHAAEQRKTWKLSRGRMPQTFRRTLGNRSSQLRCLPRRPALVLEGLVRLRGRNFDFPPWREVQRLSDRPFGGFKLGLLYRPFWHSRSMAQPVEWN